MPPHRNIKIIKWFNFFGAFRLSAPISVLYFQHITGSFASGMSVFSIVFISAALFEIPTGIFSDKIGRKNTLILGTLSNVLALILYSIGISPIILFIGAVSEGIGRSFFSGNNEALLRDTLMESGQENAYHEHLGKTSSVLELATAISAIIGGLIASISFSLVMWLSVIPQIVSLMLSFTITEPVVHAKKVGNIFSHLRQALQKFKVNKKLQLLSTTDIIKSGIGDTGYEFQAAFYNLIWPVWALGFARAISASAGGISYYISGKVINRFSAIKILILSSILMPIIKIMSVIVITPLSPFIMASTSIFHGVSYVSENTLQHKEFTNDQRATMASIISLGASLCYAVAAVLIGFIADKAGIISAIIFVQLITLSTSYLYMQIFKNHK